MSEAKTFWVSWWSGNYADDGCTTPPFRFWVSGQRDRAGNDDRDECSLCAHVRATDADEVFALITVHFPDHKMRFCEEKSADWRPGDRFPPHAGEKRAHDV